MVNVLVSASLFEWCLNRLRALLHSRHHCNVFHVVTLMKNCFLHSRHFCSEPAFPFLFFDCLISVIFTSLSHTATCGWLFCCWMCIIVFARERSSHDWFSICKLGVCHAKFCLLSIISPSISGTADNETKPSCIIGACRHQL